MSPTTRVLLGLAAGAIAGLVLATAGWPFLTSIDESFYFKPDAGLTADMPGPARLLRS